jgi:hypothetical protein
LTSAVLLANTQHGRFSIALFIADLAFDLVAQSRKTMRPGRSGVFHRLGAAASTLPVLAIGIVPSQLQGNGHKLKGVFAAALGGWRVSQAR